MIHTKFLVLCRYWWWIWWYLCWIWEMVSKSTKSGET